MLNVKLRRVAAAALVAALALPAQVFAEEDAVIISEPVITAPAPTPMPPGAIPGMPGALPETAISKEEALAIIGKWFALPEGPGRLDVNLNVRGTVPVWEYLYTVEHSTGSSSSYIGQVDAQTGRVLQFSQPMGGQFQPIRTGPLKQQHTEMAAWLKAYELVEAMYPEVVGRFKMAPAGLDSVYSYMGLPQNAWQFKWVEFVGGVPVPGSYIQVAVDKESLALVSLYAHIDDRLTFGLAEAKLTADEAMEQFQAQVRATLSYQPVLSRDPYGQRPAGMNLVYRMEHLSLWLDAQTGKPVTPGYSSPWEPRPSAPQPVPAGEYETVRPASLPVTNEDVPVLLAPVLQLLPEGSQLHTDHYYYHDPYGGVPPISVRLESPDGRSGSITVDPLTGRVRNAYRWSYSEAPARDWTDAEKAEGLAAAIKVVQVLYGDLIPELRVSAEPMIYPYERQSEARFHFQRHVNGIPVTSDGISVVIALDSMDWTNISSSWTDGLEFPDPAGAIDAETALELFLSGRKPLLVWETQYLQDPYTRPYDPAFRPERKSVLVYQLSRRVDRPEAAFINALNGLETDHSGSLITPFAAVDLLLGGHWAEGELRYMLSMGLLDLSEIQANAEISRGDMLKLLVHGARYMRMGYGGRPVELPFADVPLNSPYYPVVTEAYRQGWIKGGDRFEAERPATRIEVALWLARSLQLNRLMSSNIQVMTGFADLDGLTREERNAVVLLEALGVISSGEQFRPHESMTTVEAAALGARLFNEMMMSGR